MAEVGNGGSGSVADAVFCQCSVKDREVATQQPPTPLAESIEALADEWDRHSDRMYDEARGAERDAAIVLRSKSGTYAVNAERLRALLAREQHPDGGDVGALAGVNFWNRLGVDKGGLPTHLPFTHTKDCEGPTEPDPPHHVACWCKDEHTCPLSVALNQAHQWGSKIGAVRRVMKLCDEWDALSKGETPTTKQIRAAVRGETE
jgi:hypothetical protein